MTLPHNRYKIRTPKEKALDFAAFMGKTAADILGLGCLGLIVFMIYAYFN